LRGVGKRHFHAAWGSSLFFLLFLQALLAGEAQARFGLIEYSYTSSSTETETARGTTETDSDIFTQRYHLNLSKRLYLYPNISFGLGGTLELVRSGGEEERKYRFSPSTDMNIKAPPFFINLGYDRLQDKRVQNETSFPVLIRDTYNLFVRWTPEGIPPVLLTVSRSKTHDKEREVQDSVSTFVSASTAYKPLPELDLRYQTGISWNDDELNNFTSRTISQSARVSYSRVFMNRYAFAASYGVNRQQAEAEAGGENIFFQVFPFAGLASIDDSPLQGALPQNQALIDGNVDAAAGVNLGHGGGVNVDKVNMGFDFLSPARVSRIQVWVEGDLDADVASTFRWDIYVSNNNFDWELLASDLSAGFDSFDDFFELNFPTSERRYLKVVTTPVSIGVPGAPQVIQVTELKAFVPSTVGATAQEAETTSHSFNTSFRARLRDVPLVNYDTNFFYRKTEDEDFWTVSNGVDITHSFSRALSGTARLSRDDAEGGSVAYNYTAGLSYTHLRLRSLTHSLGFNGRIEETRGKTRTSNSLFAGTSANIYTGVSANASGGITVSDEEEGSKTENITFRAGLNLRPRRNLGMNLSHAASLSRSSGGPLEEDETVHITSIGVSYTPYPRLSLAYGVSIEYGQETTQRFNFGWSPSQLGGDIQFGFAYNEAVLPDRNGKTRNMTSSIRWKIIPRAILDVSYVIFTNETDAQDSITRNLNWLLRITV